MTTLDIKTRNREEMIEITQQIQDALTTSRIQEGTCVLFVPHTTAGVTINEHADPSVKADILMSLKQIVPDSLPYSHAEGNSPAHVKASLIGISVVVLVKEGRLRLGTWQGIFFCEFDGPRNRKLVCEIKKG